MSKQRFEELKTLTEKWAYERGITVNGKLATQMLKLVSEAGELSGHLYSGESRKIKDDIGDCVVVLCNMAVLSGGILSYPYARTVTEDSIDAKLLMDSYMGKMADQVIKNQDISKSIDEVISLLAFIATDYVLCDITECWAEAYDDIKDRKGFLNEHGNFIKNTDPGYEEAYNKFLKDQRQLKMEL